MNRREIGVVLVRKSERDESIERTMAEVRRLFLRHGGATALYRISSDRRAALVSVSLPKANGRTGRRHFCPCGIYRSVAGPLAEILERDFRSDPPFYHAVQQWDMFRAEHERNGRG